jgi:cell division transport system ATP-binding protein
MIELFHVTKKYQGELKVLNDLTFSVEKSEFVFVTGPSGAGKTTLLKLIFGSEPVSEGQILVGGHNIAGLKSEAIPYLRRKIGFVFQDFKLIESRTIYENVAFTLEVLGLAPKKIKERVWHILKDFGLTHRMNLYPRAVSGGEQQRAAIARALVGDPLIILADEPTGNLDWGLTEEIMGRLIKFNARGTTIIVATHDHNILSQYPKRTIALERGRLVTAP